MDSEPLNRKGRLNWRGTEARPPCGLVRQVCAAKVPIECPPPLPGDGRHSLPQRGVEA